jgi:hypothetical protein
MIRMKLFSKRNHQRNVLVMKKMKISIHRMERIKMLILYLFDESMDFSTYLIIVQQEFLLELSIAIAIVELSMKIADQ